MKKIISIFLAVLLLVSTIYIPTFAAAASDEDIIVYTVPTETLLEDDFEVQDGEIGEPVKGFSHLIAWGTQSTPNLEWAGNNYATFTYEYGVGGNAGNVGKLYDFARTQGAERFDANGNPDNNVLVVTQRNTDTWATKDLLAGVTRVVTKFKYYNPNSVRSSNGASNGNASFRIMYPKVTENIKGNISSTTPMAVFYPTYATMSIIDKDHPENNATKKIEGLQTNRWYDVEFEAVYSQADHIATFYLRVDGQEISAYISRVETWLPTGYDEPNAFSMSCFYGTGGLFYIDDLEIVKMAIPSENFEAAVEEFTFNEVVSGETNNTKTNVYEAWPAGLITNYQRGNDSYEVQWTSSDPSVISNDGKIVNQKSYAQKVDLTAKIIDSADVYATRTFKDVVVAPLEGASVETILNEYAQNNIVESAFSDEVTENSNKITKDLLPLPTRDDAANIDIEWNASPAGYIDVATGEITRPSFSAEDVEVTLTASLSRDGSAPVTKNIKYTVAKNIDPSLVLDEVTEELSITTEDVTEITKDLTLPSLYKDVEIAWDTTGHSQIASNGAVTRGDAEVTGTITATFSFDGATRTKDYTLTVLPTVQKMLEIDVNIIDKTGWDALTGDFNVPLVGQKYSSILTWTSSSDYIQIGEGGHITVKRPPNASPSDINANLVVNARIGRDEKTISIPVTVLRQASDADAVQEAADSINFDLIRGANTDQLAVTSNLPLPTGFEYDKGLVVEWTSSNEGVVKKNGEVIRPLPGEEDISVTLTAVVKKNYSASAPATVTFKVKALTDENELLDEAKDALTFSTISSESIDNVKENLTLSNVGKYGSTIEWLSNSQIITVSGTQGIVSSPEWGDSDASVILKAIISYGDKSVEKSFNVTVPVSDTYVDNVAIVNESFNSWTNEFQFNTSTPNGSWSTPISGVDTDIVVNVGGASNNAIYLSKVSNENSGFLTFTFSKTVESNSFRTGFKFYVDDEFTANTMFEVITKGSGNNNVATVYLNGTDSTVEVVTANGGSTQTTLKLEKGIFLRNAWNDFKFDINTKTKKFHLYLNGECITANGFVTEKVTGNPFVSVNGIPYSNSSAAGIDGIRWLLDGAIGDTMYVDDYYAQTYAVHTEDQRRAAEIWEMEFLSTVNLNHIESDFVFPLSKVDGVSVKYHSNNSYVINTQGNKGVLYTPVTDPTPVTLTISFDNGTTIYKKVYTCMVYPKKVVVETITDEQAAAADLKTVVDYIEGNYTLTKLKKDLVLNGIKVANNSTITYSSSDESVITSNGKITMADTLKTAKFTVTARKGSASKSQIIDITVAAKAPIGGGPVGGGNGGGGGGKPVVGENTNTQSGIDIGTPDDGENQGQTSQFKDLSDEHWAYNEINFLVEKEILNGVGDGKFEPERTINREEFVKMLCVSLNLTLKDASADFTDVDKNEWYAPYVATIKEKGLILGYEDGSFGIGQNISRQDLAVLIYRSSRLAAEAVEETFKDDAEIADYAKDAVYTLKDLSIINGKGDGKFDPTASATRAETATMLYKAIKAGLFE